MLFSLSTPTAPFSTEKIDPSQRNMYTASMKNLLLVFDFDGTIADTFQHIFNISNQLAVEFNFKTVAPHEIEKMKDKSFQEVIKHLNVPILHIPTLLYRAKKELNKDITSVQPIQGLQEVLGELKELGYRMGILTSNSARNVRTFLETHHLDYFDFISTSSKLTGKNKHLHRLIKKEKIQANQLVYIGDETRDIEAAQTAGVKMAAVTWGYNSEKALQSFNPDIILRKPTEMTNILPHLHT